jgi:hypothetical protein
MGFGPVCRAAGCHPAAFQALIFTKKFPKGSAGGSPVKLYLDPAGLGYVFF